MKQPEDTKTIELPIDKRGRGRPAKADKLTQAERARRYREKRKSEGIKSDATENQQPLKNTWTWRAMAKQLEAENAELRAKNEQKKFEFSEFTKLEQENERLKRQLNLAEDERDTAFKAFAELKELVKLNTDAVVQT